MLKGFHRRTKKLPKRKTVYLVVASAENLPFREKAFDFVTIFHTLHHCPNRQETIKEMVRVANGVILLEPNKESIIHRIAYFIKSLRKTKFSITGFPENLVEFNELGFTAKEIVNDLKFLGMKNTYACSTGILPTWFPLPRVVIKILLTVEGLIQRIPILKRQLGTILVVSHN